MRIEDQVVSLELALLMKDLGWPQGPYGPHFHWCEYPGGVGAPFVQFGPGEGHDVDFMGHPPRYICAAPTVPEVGEGLPKWVGFHHVEGRWKAECPRSASGRPVGEGPIVEYAETEADARALLWITLHAEGGGAR